MNKHQYLNSEKKKILYLAPTLCLGLEDRSEIKFINISLLHKNLNL